MSSGGSATPATDPLNAERAQAFAILGRLLTAAPEAGLLRALAGLQPDNSPLGEAVAGLARAAGETTADAVEREYHTLFIGVSRGEVLPYASYYLTGFLHERPLAELRAELARLGIQRAAGIAEPEDHLGFCCEVMGGLLAGDFAGGPAAAEEFLRRHLRPWASRCFADLEGSGTARFYKAVGALGRRVMEIEAAAAELAA